MGDTSVKQSYLRVPVKSVPQGRLGLWILIAGELVIFGGFIACYLLYRLRFPEWGEQAKHTNTFFGALNTFVLLFSSFSVVKAHEAANKRDLGKITMWMLITIVCGLLFLVNKTIEYSHEIAEGFTLTSPALLAAGNNTGSLFWSFYYGMTGLHGLHVLAGMVTLFIIWLDARKGNNLHRVELGGMYWHMVDLIWIFLFPLLYLVR
jgi:heme/copper-type cytochrome/quinol oxidase subunit 3